MRLTVPITGTVLVEGEVQGKGNLVGDPKDPIRPVPIDLGNVSWTMIDVDLENETMIIEVQPALVVSEEIGEGDSAGKSIGTRRNTTGQERAGFLQYARNLVEGHTKDELRAMGKAARLNRPFRSTLP